MDNIYLVSEEQLTYENIEIILRKHFEAKLETCIKTNVSVSQTSINTYKVHGIRSNNVSNIELIIARGSGSFVDVLVYREQTSDDLNKKTPTEIWEITKNAPGKGESGNMTSQRLSKIVSINNSGMSGVPFYYLIDHNETISESDVNKSNATTLGYFQALGANILFTTQDSTEATEYYPKNVPKSLKDLEHNGRVNFCNIDKAGNVTLKSNLYKNKKTKSGSHDPNVGWVCGMIGLCSKLNSKSIVLESNRDISSFKAENKLIKVLNHYNVEVSYNGKKLVLPKSKKQQDYWSPETTGEKLSTISLHYKALNNGLDPIFHNHAGCEKGYVKRITSELVQPAGGKGLPDFVYADHVKKILYVIEGEREDNYLSGLKQVKDPEFKNWIKRELSTYQGYSAEAYIVTNGTANSNNVHNFYSTQENNLHFFNKNAKPVYTISL